MSAQSLKIKSPNFSNLSRISERFDLDAVGLNYIELSFGSSYRDFKAKLNNEEIFTLKDGSALYQPRTFILSDGAALKVAVSDIGGRPVRTVFYNGKKLRESPTNTITLVSRGFFVYAFFQTLLSYFAAVDPMDSLRIGLGYGTHSLIIGLIYLGLSVLISAKSFQAATFSACLYAGDVIYSQLFQSQLSIQERIWLALGRLLLLIPIIQSVGAVKRTKENEYFHKLAGQHEYEEDPKTGYPKLKVFIQDSSEEISGAYELILPMSWDTHAAKHGYHGFSNTHSRIGTLEIFAHDFSNDDDVPDPLEELKKYLSEEHLNYSRESLASFIHGDRKSAEVECTDSKKQFWKVWVFLEGNKLLFITYCCDIKNKNWEITVVNNIVKSIKITDDPGLPPSF